MPRKSDSIPINDENLDRRRVLLDVDKINIKIQYESGQYSMRQLAAMYGCSRRSIQFAVYPERLAENKKRRAERGGSKIYYGKEKHTKYMKDHRDYKKTLSGAGKLGK